MIRMSFDKLALRRISIDLYRMLNKVRNKKPLLRKIGMRYLDLVRKDFEKGGNPTWKPLSDITLMMRLAKKSKSTKARAAKRGVGKGQIGFDNGLMYKSLFIGKPDNIFKVKENSLEVGVKHKAAKNFQKGLKIPVTVKMRAYFYYNIGVKLGARITIPARPFLVMLKSYGDVLLNLTKNIILKEGM